METDGLIKCEDFTTQYYGEKIIVRYTGRGRKLSDEDFKNIKQLHCYKSQNDFYVNIALIIMVMTKE